MVSFAQGGISASDRNGRDVRKRSLHVLIDLQSEISPSALCRHGIAPHAIRRTTPVVISDPRSVSAVTTASFFSETHPKWDIRVMAIRVPRTGTGMVQN